MTKEIIFVLCLVASLVGGMGWLISKAVEHDARLMTECMVDHKEYECAAMLHRDPPPSTVFVYGVNR